VVPQGIRDRRDHAQLGNVGGAVRDRLGRRVDRVAKPELRGVGRESEPPAEKRGRRDDGRVAMPGGEYGQCSRGRRPNRRVNRLPHRCNAGNERREKLHHRERGREHDHRRMTHGAERAGQRVDPSHAAREARQRDRCVRADPRRERDAECLDESGERVHILWLRDGSQVTAGASFRESRARTVRRVVLLPQSSPDSFSQ